MRILIDMDGVIADFEGDFLRLWKEIHPEKKFISLSERRGFYLSEQYPEEYLELVREIYHGPGFYKNLPLIDGALEALTEIKEKFNYVFLCTSPMIPAYDNCVVEKYHWVMDNLGDDWINKIILTRDKTIIRGDILIDDNPEIKGIETPEWEHIIFDQPYNRNINDKRRMNWRNWKTILIPTSPLIPE